MVSSSVRPAGIRRAQAWRRAPRRADPLRPLRAQADAEVHRRQARHPALQLQPAWIDHGAPHCIAFGGLRVDDAIENALLAVVGPGAIAAATAAEKEAGQRRDQVRGALGRDLEAARYAADRAFRQYDTADPANRLVAGELEARWNGRSRTWRRSRLRSRHIRLGQITCGSSLRV